MLAPRTIELSERALNPNLWRQIRHAARTGKLTFGRRTKILSLRDGHDNFSLCVDCEKSAAGSPVRDASLKGLDHDAVDKMYRAHRHVSCPSKAAGEAAKPHGVATQSTQRQTGQETPS